MHNIVSEDKNLRIRQAISNEPFRYQGILIDFNSISIDLRLFYDSWLVNSIVCFYILFSSLNVYSHGIMISRNWF